MIFIFKGKFMKITKELINSLYFDENLISSALYSKISNFVRKSDKSVNHIDIIDSLPTFVDKAHFLVAILADIANCNIQDDFLKDLEYLINNL